MDRYDNDLPQPENFSHTLEEGEVVQLCAGMPQSGTREFDPEEIEELMADRVLLLHMVFARFTMALFCLVLSGCAFAFLRVSADISLWLKVLVGVPAIVALLWGLVALFRTLELLLRRRVLRRAVEAGYVRIFEGAVNPDDYTDKSLRWLLPTGLLYEDGEQPNRVELYPKDNVVHSLNDCEPDGWYPLILTCAAAVPEDALVLDVPNEWFPEAAEGRMQRRRQTAAEQHEILSYAAEGRRRLRIILPLWVISTFLAVVFLMGRLLQLDLVLSAVVAGVLAATVALQQGITIWRKTRALATDAEFGWIMILTPDPSEESSDDEYRDSDVAMEFLPVSETVWSLAGRPAGWRYAAQLQPRS